MNRPLIVILGVFLSFADGAQEVSREQEALLHVATEVYFTIINRYTAGVRVRNGCDRNRRTD